MNDFKHKISMLRRFYLPQRHAANPLIWNQLQRDVVEGRENQFIHLVGFRDQSIWSKRCSGKVRFTEPELKIISRFFRLDDLVDASEEGWQLLTDRYPHEHFALRLVEKGYGTLQSFTAAVVGPVGDAATLADLLNPLLSVAAGFLEINFVEGTQERGAAERGELEALNLMRLVQAWTPYAYGPRAYPNLKRRGDLVAARPAANETSR